MGEEHGAECVIPTKTVVVEYRLKMIRTVPAYWGKHEIEFHMNDSSWCASNFLDDIPEDACICPVFEGKFVREASEADEDEFGLEPAAREGE